MSEQDTPPPPPFNNEPPSQPTPAETVQEAFQSPPATSSVGLSQGKMGENDEKTMGLLAHLLGAITSLLGPLVIYLLKKDESPFVEDQAKEALNFHITVFFGYIVLGVVSFLPFIGCIASFGVLVLYVVGVVFSVLGGLAAQKGQVYRYPFALRLIK